MEICLFMMMTDLVKKLFVVVVVIFVCLLAFVLNLSAKEYTNYIRKRLFRLFARMCVCEITTSTSLFSIDDHSSFFLLYLSLFLSPLTFFSVCVYVFICTLWPLIRIGSDSNQIELN